MEWEAIVNKHSNDKKHNEKCARRKMLERRAIISISVGFAFILSTLVNLVHPGFGETGMLVAFMIGIYNLGRLKESA